MQDYTLEDFIWQLKNAPKPEERLFAAFKLGRERNILVLQPLIDASTDPDASVRARVAEALGTRDETSVIPALIHLLTNDEDSVVRRTAAKSLGHIGNNSAAQALVSALSDADETVRAQSAEALGTCSDENSAEPLVQVFLHDADATVRYFARLSLANIGGATVVDSLLNALHHTDDPALLVEIIEILGQTYNRRALEPLKALADHADPDVKAMARWAIQALGG